MNSGLRRPGGLVVIDTHPVQYRAPLYRTLQQEFGIPVTCIYASDFSVEGYRDREFGTSFSWDTDLLGGYRSVFVSRVAKGGPASFEALGRELFTARLLLESDPAAVLIVGYDRPFFWQGFWHAWKAGLPILFRGETTDHAQVRSVLKSWIRDAVLQGLYRRCAALLYVGERSRRHFRRLGVRPDKLAFSPYCVDTAPFQTGESDRYALRGSARAALGLTDDRTVLLMSGKLSPRKGPDLTIAAVKSLPARERNSVALLFLGAGAMHDELAAAAATEPRVVVRFLGFRNQRELSPCYHAADLLVMASRELETWGLVVNEALHHGLPVVVSDAVGCADDMVVCGETGERFESGSSMSLASALLRAANLVGRPATRESCRSRVAAYSLRAAASGIAQAFAALAGPNERLASLIGFPDASKLARDSASRDGWQSCLNRLVAAPPADQGASALVDT